MKRTILLPIALVVLCSGCDKARVVSVQGAAKMNVGEHVSCIYSGEKLYCMDQLVSKQEVDKRHMMDRVVFAVRAQVNHDADNSSSAEGESYSIKFTTDTIDYSLWDCSKTGSSNPAIRCTLQQNPDPKRVTASLDAAKFEESVVTPLTQDHLIALCGGPKEIKTDAISSILIYPTKKPGIVVSVYFNTLHPPTRLQSIETVDEKTGQFFVGGMIWNRGDNDEDAIKDLKTYMPCLK